LAVAGALAVGALDDALTDVAEVDAAVGLEGLTLVSPEAIGAMDEILPICIAVSLRLEVKLARKAYRRVDR